MQYAERAPIGKEDIIQNIPASKVLAFYKRWYRPQNMAVIAVGDFDDDQAVVNMIKQRLGECKAAETQAEQIPKCVHAAAAAACHLMQVFTIIIKQC